MAYQLRTAHPADLPYLYDICRKTGLAGADASPLVRDPHLLGQLFVAPYVIHDARFCLTLCDNGLPVGYVVGAPDILAWQRWFSAEWLPVLRQFFGQAGEPISEYERWALSEVAEPKPPQSFLDGYPAHLHIDLMPSTQGQGWGRRLMEAFLDRLRGAGVVGCHLCVGADNQSAIAFYRKMGYQVLAEAPGSLYMGIKLDVHSP